MCGIVGYVGERDCTDDMTQQVLPYLKMEK